jgi:hypothetical protein
MNYGRRPDRDGNASAAGTGRSSVNGSGSSAPTRVRQCVRSTPNGHVRHRLQGRPDIPERGTPVRTRLGLPSLLHRDRHRPSERRLDFRSSHPYRPRYPNGRSPTRRRYGAHPGPPPARRGFAGDTTRVGGVTVPGWAPDTKMNGPHPPRRRSAHPRQEDEDAGPRRGGLPLRARPILLRWGYAGRNQH